MASMKRKASTPYWEMTAEELHEATKRFDEEFVAEKSRALTPEEQKLWEEVRTKRSTDDAGTATIVVSLDKALLDRCTALAKKKRLSRNALIARGLHAVLAVEGE